MPIDSDFPKNHNVIGKHSHAWLLSVPFTLDLDLYFQFRDLVLSFVPQQGHHPPCHSRNI